MANFKKSWRTEVGLNHVPAYQVSGRPFATGGLDARETISVDFPYLTRWIYIHNSGADDLKVGYSLAGVSGSYFFRVPSRSSNREGNSARLEVKVSQLWFTGSTDFDVAAGLTTISPERVSGSLGPNFSGSIGVG